MAIETGFREMLRKGEGGRTPMLNQSDLVKQLQEKPKDVVVETPNSDTNEPPSKPKSKLIVPIIIGVGAILVGVVIYFVTKKKK